MGGYRNGGQSLWTKAVFASVCMVVAVKQNDMVHILEYHTILNTQDVMGLNP